MPDLVGALREEIRKQARKEIRATLDRTKKLVSNHRQEIAQLKRELAAAHKRLAFLESCEKKRITDGTQKEPDTSKLRFSAKSVKSHRNRLGFSADEYGLLLGVSAQTIYQWERGKSRPRKSQLAALAEMRAIGKKEARSRLRLMTLQEES